MNRQWSRRPRSSTRLDWRTLALALALIAVALAAGACARRGLGEYTKAEALAAIADRELAFTEAEFFDRIRRDDVVAVTAYLAAGMDPDAEHGKPLAMAVAGGRKGLVELLLEAGADPGRASGAFGQTPLATAVMRADVEIVGILLEAGAAPDAPTPGGATALHLAPDVETARLLLEAGGTADARDRLGATPLMRAVAAGDMARVDLLLRYGADPTALDHGGRSPMLLATAMRFPAIADRLRAAGGPALPAPRVQHEVLDAYAGRYGRDVVEYQVVHERGRLFLIEKSGSGNGTLQETELLPLTEDTFFRDSDAGANLLRFEREDGRVVAVSRSAGTERVRVPRLLP